MASTDGGSTINTLRVHRAGSIRALGVGPVPRAHGSAGSAHAGRASRAFAATIAFALTLLATAVPAAAESFDVELPNDITIDLTTDTDPELQVDLQRTNSAGTTEVAFSLVAGTPLGSACDFVAREGLPATVHATATVTFTIRDADRCDLTSLDADEVTLSSRSIDDANLTATLKREPKFPLDKFANALRNAAAVAAIVVVVSALIAWAWWAYKGKSGGRFWRHPLDSPTLTWSFNESWLTNLTALGALLATLLGLTDVLDVIGPKKPDRAVLLLVNFAGLALAASALIAYLALRGYSLKTTKTAQVPIRLQVRANSTSAGVRQLRAELPSVCYTRDDSGKLTRAAQLGAPTARQWDNSGHHVAVVAISQAVTGSDAPAPALVALEIPSAGTHAPTAVLLYDASIPELGKVDPKDQTKYVPLTTEESRTKAHGRMVGFVAAGLLASVGVAIQLAATYKVLDRAELSDGARQAGFAVLLILVLCALCYVVTTIVARIPEVDTPEPKAALSTASLPRQTLETAASTVPDPVAPAAILNATGANILALDGFEEVTLTSPGDLGAIAFPTLTAYHTSHTSSGDDPIVRRARGETAF